MPDARFRKKKGRSASADCRFFTLLLCVLCVYVVIGLAIGRRAICVASQLAPVLDRVAAEFLEQRVRQHEGDHGLRHDGQRRDGAHRSLLAAGLSAIVVRSTERRGFINVAMGHIDRDADPRRW
jgi:hypothetical protein